MRIMDDLASCSASRLTRNRRPSAETAYCCVAVPGAMRTGNNIPDARFRATADLAPTSPARPSSCHPTIRKRSPYRSCSNVVALLHWSRSETSHLAPETAEHKSRSGRIRWTDTRSTCRLVMRRNAWLATDVILGGFSIRIARVMTLGDQTSSTRGV